MLITKYGGGLIMDIKEVEKEYCSRCPSYKYGCGFITRELQDKCVQLSDYVDGYEKGYEQAKKDIIGKVRSILNKVACENYGLDVNGDYCEQPYVELDNEVKKLLKED